MMQRSHGITMALGALTIGIVALGDNLIPMTGMHMLGLPRGSIADVQGWFLLQDAGLASLEPYPYSAER